MGPCCGCVPHTATASPGVLFEELQGCRLECFATGILPSSQPGLLKGRANPGSERKICAKFQSVKLSFTHSNVYPCEMSFHRVSVHSRCGLDAVYGGDSRRERCRRGSGRLMRELIECRAVDQEVSGESSVRLLKLLFLRNSWRGRGRVRC